MAWPSSCADRPADEGPHAFRRRTRRLESHRRPRVRPGRTALRFVLPGAAIASDAQDAAELARRWNAYPHLVAALERVAVTGNVRHAVGAANEVLGKLKRGAA